MDKMVYLEGEAAPYECVIHAANGLFVKQMVIPHAGTQMLQHSHEYPHVTTIAAGEAELFVDNEFIGTYAAPACIEIAASKKHRFKTLCDYVIIYCIHRTELDETEPRRLEDHTLEDVKE